MPCFTAGVTQRILSSTFLYSDAATMYVRPPDRPSYPLTPATPLAPSCTIPESGGLGKKKKTSSHPNKNSAFRKSSFWSIARSAGVRGGGSHK
jgi:hypothetical protein